jgi:hemerythrin
MHPFIGKEPRVMLLRNGDQHPDVGHETVDREHQVQLGLVDALCTAVGKAGGETDIREILDRLLEYSRIHFLSEQLLMRLHAYPEYETHAVEHDRMIAAMEEIRQSWQEGRLESRREIIEALRHDLIGHIHRQDRELGRHLTSCGVGSSEG